MGNKLNSDVSEGVKKQAEGDTIVYKFIDVKGGGQLVELLKKVSRAKNYTELDDRIREAFRPYLYNDGQAALIHVRDLVHTRRFGAPPNLAPTSKSAVEMGDVESPSAEKESVRRHGGARLLYKPVDCMHIINKYIH